MPRVILQGPDGNDYEVTAPEGATKDQIIQYAQQQFAAGALQPIPEQAPTEGPGAMTRLARGVEDPVTGLAQLAERTLPESISGGINRADQWLYENTGGLFGNPYESFDQGVRTEEAEYQAAREAGGQTGIDWMRGGGNVLSALPMAFAGPAAPASLGGRAALAAGESGLMSAAMPVTEGDYWSEKGMQVGAGAAAGGMAAPVLAGASRMLAPKIDEGVQLLRDAGIVPSPGQIMGGRFKVAEEKLRSIPIFGDLITRAHNMSSNEFNRAIYNRALNPIGENALDVPIGREGVEHVSTRLGRAYDELLPRLTFQADPQFISGMQNLQLLARNLAPDDAAQFERLIQNNLYRRMTPSGRMSGESLKAVEESLGKIAKGYRGDASFDKRQLGDALEEALHVVRQTVERSTPDLADQLRQINTGYANYAILRKAGSMAGADDGVSPAQLASAIRNLDQSVGKGDVARGRALMQDLSDEGYRVLRQEFPNSGTFDRAILAGGALSTAAYNPLIPGGLLAAGSLYTRPMQRGLASALQDRPELMRQAGGLVGLPELAPAVGFGAGGIMYE